MHHDKRLLWPGTTLLLAAIQILCGLAVPAEFYSLDLSFLSVASTIPAAISCAIVPHWKLGGMAYLYRMPKNTYALSRDMFRLGGSTLGALTISAGILALVRDATVAFLLLPYGAASLTLFLSMTKRFKRHPNAEFAMPAGVMYPFGRRMKKNSVSFRHGG